MDNTETGALLEKEESGNIIFCPSFFPNLSL